jgi:hypothetical protein
MIQRKMNAYKIASEGLGLNILIDSLPIYAKLKENLIHRSSWKSMGTLRL